MANIDVRKDLSALATNDINNQFNSNIIDPGAFRKPDFWVYLYSISKKEHVVSRAPMISRLVLHACPDDQEYTCVAKFAHPFEQSDRDVDTGEVRVRYHNARAVAQDIVCPDASSMDSPVPLTTLSVNTDLRKLGLFWTTNNPPTDEEVKKAYKRLEDHYRDCLARADALEHDPVNQNLLVANKDYHDACEYFGVERKWHTTPKRKKAEATKVECVNCGEEIRDGAAFHFSQESGLCVIDWKRAYEAGKVKKADVPESKIWWDTTPTGILNELKETAKK